MTLWLLIAFLSGEPTIVGVYNNPSACKMARGMTIGFTPKSAPVCVAVVKPKDAK
jgi:hypothetical protein